MTQTPDAVLRAWFDEVWNKRDESAIDRLMHPQAVAHGLGPQPLEGPAGFRGVFHTFTNALDDIKIDVVRTVTQDDMCLAHCHVTAKHVGPTLGGPPTNNRVDYWGMTLARVKDGQIIEGWNCFDFLKMYQQIGWVGDPVLPA